MTSDDDRPSSGDEKRNQPLSPGTTGDAVKEIFADCCDQPPGERDAFLRSRCVGDADLRRAVDELLKAHDEAGRFFAGPTRAARLGEEALAAVGQWIGRYKLLQLIGEGGFGTVYMAEQEQPVRRRVALKIIKLGMDTKAVIARFEAERQALAMMDHPNIARVFDAGATDAARPYFVMELVRGVPITDYCDTNNQPVRERLELFVQVCQAVQHAHQKGIIHRDIKPNNVMVAMADGRPTPKVIDFGIAKATDQRLTEKTLFTDFHQMIGTPQYMSPEQAEMAGIDIDTRSDIYSLGVLLYELLVGSTPFDPKELRGKAYGEMQRMIREVEPPLPSTRLSTMIGTLPSIAAHRRVEPKRLGQLVRGELDWITMKALEKDRSRRYETANGLASDVRRYLDDEPVQACPPSARYRFRKFARRNKVALLMVSLAVAGLLTLVVGLAVSNHMIAAERNQKTQALALAEAQSKRAQTNFWRASIAIRELMTRTAIGNDDVPPAVRRRFSDEAVKYYQALIQDGASDQSSRYETGVGYRTLGMVHAGWREVDPAEQCYRKSIAIFEGLIAEDPRNQQYRHQLGFACYSFGQFLSDAGRRDEGLAAFTRGEALYEKLLMETPDSYDYANELAKLLQQLSALQGQMGKHQDAKSSSSRSVEMSAKLAEGRSGPNPYPAEQSKNWHWVERSNIKRQLGFSFRDAQQYDEAELAFRQAIGILETARVFDPQSAYFLYFLADTHRQIGLVEISCKRLDKAEEELRRAVEIHQQCMENFPEGMLNNPERAECYSDLNRLLVSAGRVQEAKSIISAIKIPPKDFHLRIFHAGFLNDTAEWQQAFAEYSQIIEESPQQAEAWTGRAFSYFNRQQWEPAIADFSKAIELDPQVHQNWFHRGSAYIALAQWDKAAADFTKVIDGWPDDIWGWYSRAQIYAQTHRPAEAIADLRQAVARGFNDPVRMKTEIKFEPIRLSDEFKKLVADLEIRFRPALDTVKGAEYLQNTGELDEAIRVCSEILSQKPDDGAAWLERANCYSRAGAFAKAVEDYTQAIKLKPDTGWAWHERGYCYLMLGEHKKAIADHSKTIELGDTDAGERLRRGYSYEALGDLAKAEADYSRAIELSPGDGEAWWRRGALDIRQGQPDKAKADFSNAITHCSNNPNDQNALAWELAADPDPNLRDPKSAVELAEKAVAAQPTDGNIWNTLGVAQYRAGNWQAAVTALNKSMELRHGGDANDWYFLAMASQQLGQTDAARKWYGHAIGWEEKNSASLQTGRSNELRRFRDEAASCINPTTQTVSAEHSTTTAPFSESVEPLAK